ncbi:MAG: hypothetical protein JNM60_08590 [Candidatus Competibacteraceae bacterium]|nr:hypothetical protein [Candidatus Competibacteraceae bacterium]
MRALIASNRCIGNPTLFVQALPSLGQMLGLEGVALANIPSLHLLCINEVYPASELIGHPIDFTLYSQFANSEYSSY